MGPGYLPQMAVKSRMQIVVSVVKLLWTQHIHTYFNSNNQYVFSVCSANSKVFWPYGVLQNYSFVQPQNYRLNGSIWTNSNLCLILFLPWVGFKFIQIGCFLAYYQVIKDFPSYKCHWTKITCQDCKKCTL